MQWPFPLIIIILLGAIAYFTAKKGVAIFTLIGFLLIWHMGLWAETMAMTLLIGCGKQDQSAAEGDGERTAAATEEDKTAELVYVNWAEGIAYTNLAKIVLEEKLGYEVTITSADVGPAYTAVAEGDQDVEDVARQWMNANSDLIDEWVNAAQGE